MNTGVVSSMLTCIFLFFLIVGFLYGLWRGFSKSLIRLIIVVAVAVATFFVVPAISTKILTADISSWNLTVNEVSITSLDQFISEFLASFEMIKDFMNASPTFTKFIGMVPAVLVNVLLFIVFFFIVKMLSMVIYWIFAGIFFNKKKMEGKNKHRFIGAIIGAFQGLLVACVVLMPIFGFVNLADNAQTALSQSQTELEATLNGTTPAPATMTADDNNSGENPESEEITIDEALKTVKEYTQALESNFIYKALNTVGVVKLSNSVFDELTTVEIETEAGKKEYRFTTEAVEISKMYPYIDLVMSADIDIQDNDFIDKLILLVDKAYDSPLLGDIITEVLKEAATIWTNTSLPKEERLFMGIAAPDLGSDELNEILDEQLNEIKLADKEGIQTKLVDVLKIAKVANDTIKLTDELKENLSDISVENLEQIFTSVMENDTVKEVIKDVVTPETLDSLGVTDVQTQTLVVDVVTKIIDSDDIDVTKEVAATKEIFKLTEKINEAQDLHTKVELEETDVDALVDGLANSTIITELIKTKQEEETQEGVANPIKDLDISNTLSDETKTALESAIAEKEMDANTKALLEQILLGKTPDEY